MVSFPFDTLLRNVETRTCIKSGAPLGPDEVLLRRDAMPGLIGGSLTQSDNAFFVSFVKALLEKKLVFDRFPVEARMSIKSVFPHLVGSLGSGRELYLHAYIYLFWEELNFEGSNVPLSGRCFITANAKGAPMRREDERDAMYCSLITKIFKGALVDLIAIDEEKGVVFFIEVKREKLDDRAVGQTLRYYQFINNLLYRERGELNLNYARPVLVVSEAKYDKWVSFPVFFRDLVDVYGFTCDTEISFSNYRKSFLSQFDTENARGRRSLSHVVHTE
jgi:hypothetical protein